MRGQVCGAVKTGLSKQRASRAEGAGLLSSLVVTDGLVETARGHHAYRAGRKRRFPPLRLPVLSDVSLDSTRSVLADQIAAGSSIRAPDVVNAVDDSAACPDEVGRCRRNNHDKCNCRQKRFHCPSPFFRCLFTSTNARFCASVLLRISCSTICACLHFGAVAAFKNSMSARRSSALPTVCSGIFVPGV